MTWAAFLLQRGGQRRLDGLLDLRRLSFARVGTGMRPILAAGRLRGVPGGAILDG